MLLIKYIINAFFLKKSLLELLIYLLKLSPFIKVIINFKLSPKMLTLLFNNVVIDTINVSIWLSFCFVLDILVDKTERAPCNSSTVL